MVAKSDTASYFNLHLLIMHARCDIMIFFAKNDVVKFMKMRTAVF